MDEGKESIGLIAGGGKFPRMIAEAAKAQGYRVVAVAHLDETDPALEEKVDAISWIQLGQLGRLIKELKKQGVRKVLMAGTITKRRMFSGIRPDLKGLALMSRLAVFHDDGILRAVADELASQGIEVLPSTFCLPDLLAPQGCLTRRKPSRKEKEDVEFGWRIAKELGRLDIGQCVVVKDRTVLALEALEGTNETIRRGGRIAREGAVVVKASKPNQDLRFDVPSVGLETLKTMAEVRASVLAVEAGKTLLFDKQEAVAFAEENGISIISR
ncbi:MAG: UDP-2,3-diacylglucosamine diphosphatase LpxI [Deltaproteobacteria bacterium]|nr:UDP-2,3-diacylglucosamine diphosphatase LpxI [Deltaproteobacteria bacterium]MBW2127877.1 UDP-2,3-diacylglucosamine diphosphatase LpxI [Deltaproteobacteria bacterium]MBW2302871.1 UDP-2,3-diacylglucosamine diphosphatase LpxI [Deltaproteobacteria bacterium]